MMVVIVEFEIRAGAESEFEAALLQMREQVKKHDGFLGEAPCRSLDNEKKVVTHCCPIKRNKKGSVSPN